MRPVRILLGIISFIFLECLSVYLTAPWAAAAGVELHAHLFMKEGMTWMFKGAFNDPIQARNWKSRFSSQANPETLDQSELDIVVATLYAHPFCTLSLKNSIRRQIQLAREFVRNHPQWVIADRPELAQQAIAQGKRVLVLALEGASGILENEEDLKEFVVEGEIRIVTLLHLTDDSLGGVAFLNGFKGFSSPWAFLESLFAPTRDSSGIRTNSNGLTVRGKQMAISLIQHHVWIDLAHSSDISQNEMIPLMIQGGQPLLYTHTVLRKYHRAERGIHPEQLKGVAETHGFIGLMPSEEMLQGTPGKNDHLDPSSKLCKGGLFSLATQFEQMAKVVGESSIGMGSDFNGGIPHLPPSCGTGTDLDRQGLVHIGQSQQIWKGLERLGVYHGSPQETTHRFLDAWARVWAK